MQDSVNLSYDTIIAFYKQILRQNYHNFAFRKRFYGRQRITVRRNLHIKSTSRFLFLMHGFYYTLRPDVI